MNINAMYDLLDKWWDEGKQETQEYVELEEAVNLAECEAQYASYNAEEDALWERRSSKDERSGFIDAEIQELKERDPFYSVEIESEFVNDFYKNISTAY